MSCSKKLLHYKGACPWKKETKSYGRYSFQVPVYCQNYWRSGMNEKHNEWNLSHLLSLTVCKFLVNRRLSADAGVNDVFSVLSALVSLSLARSLLQFIMSITEKWASYEDRVGLWKKGMRYGLFGRKKNRYTHGWLIRLFAGCVYSCVWFHVHLQTIMYLHEFVSEVQLVYRPQHEPSVTSNVLKSQTHSLLRPLICMTKTWLII